MWRRIQQWWFLSALCLLLGIGLSYGESLAWLADRVSKPWVIAGVMLATSLATNFRRLLSGPGNAWAVVIAIAVNAGLGPPVGRLFSLVLPQELSGGLVLTMCLPCTIASAIVWTRRGEGNEVATTVVSVVTNFGCFVVLPFWTWMLLGQAVQVEPGELVAKLLACVAAPMLVGQLARRSTKLEGWLDANRVGLGLLAQLGVLSLAGVGAISAGAAMALGQAELNAGDWAALIVVVLLVHAVMLATGYLAGKLFGLHRPERLAVILAGSQKTTAVGLGVALHFGPLAVLPLVIHHFAQLVVDTVVVDLWKRKQG